jgi:hypothetical protein
LEGGTLARHCGHVRFESPSYFDRHSSKQAEGAERMMTGELDGVVQIFKANRTNVVFVVWVIRTVGYDGRHDVVMWWRLNTESILTRTTTKL